MAKHTGNYTDFIDKEIVRLKETEAETVRGEINRLSAINSTKKTNDGKGKRSKTVIR